MRMVAVLGALALALAVVSFGVAAEPEEEVLGKWITSDGKGPPMEFAKEGKFKFGWTRDGGDWKMADGTYKISKEGKIDASAGSGGVSLKMEFKLEKEAITGTVGAKNYTWKKEKK